MASRHEIQAELERKLAQGEIALERFKGRLAQAEHEASADMKEAAAAAERTLAKGKAKLSQMAEATDDEFDKLWAEAKDAWHDLSHDAERGWDKLSDRVKSFFA